MFDLIGTTIPSRLLLGTAQYPSPAILADAVLASGTSVVTVSLRREMAGGRAGEKFWSLIRSLGTRILPNTAGCHSVKEAVTTAKMARDVFGTSWIKLEVIGNHDTLQPDVFGLVEAARILCEDGFSVFPYTTDDLVVAERLLEAGCKVLMPWCAPIRPICCGDFGSISMRRLRPITRGLSECDLGRRWRTKRASISCRNWSPGPTTAERM